MVEPLDVATEAHPRRRAEDVEQVVETGDLDRLQQRLHLIGTAAKIGIWEYDFVTDELWVSDELATMYGVPADELTWENFVARLHPDDVVSPLEKPTPSYPFGRVNEFLIRVRHADGTYRNIRSRSTTYGKAGAPVRKLGVHIDMSDDALFQLARLSEANERLRHYSYMASHDMRSPLRAIGNLITMITEDYGDSLPDEAAAMLDEIDHRARGLDRLLVDMLEFATVDVEGTEPEATDVTRLLDDVVESIDHRQCAIVVDSSVDEPVRLTSHPLMVCLRNLVDNACKHHDKPSGTVTVSALLDGPWLRATVADDGPGIPVAMQERVFEPFQTSDRSRGSGLGLAHVRQQVEKYDGTIAIESAPSEGTSISVRWPIILNPHTG